ncbi:MAG: 5'/3'-nucleotidase SurE [Anaerolineaceae bacterium]|nr:5'/3'-nucleotidase SurE [Anaerolineaceae bacterium]
MNILVTNDDGVHAPGLLALAREMKKIGNVTVLAPDRNWSACGHVKTMDRPLRVRETHLKDGTSALTSDGAPSDCVALALLGLVTESIDLVVSGINPNANIGNDITYSGTVMAAMEASIAGIPGIAFSYDRTLESSCESDFDPCARIAGKIVNAIMAQKENGNLFFNVNVPALPENQIKGIRVTRLGKRIYRDELVKKVDPHGHPYYWIGGEYPIAIPEPGTDAGALQSGYVSITPLSLDLTDQKGLKLMQSWDLNLPLSDRTGE